MKTSKPAIRSLSFLGGIGSLVGIIGVISQIREIIEANPELVNETTAAIFALVTAVSTLVGLFGTWRRKLPIKGLFFEKK